MDGEGLKSFLFLVSLFTVATKGGYFAGVSLCGAHMNDHHYDVRGA